MAGRALDLWGDIASRARAALARRRPGKADPWERRMRDVSRRAEADMVEHRGETFYAELYLDHILAGS